MTNETALQRAPRTGATGPSRRMILRNGLIVGAGAVVAGTLTVANAGTAKAATADGPQGGWAWCSKCQGLYFVNSTLNVCPYDAVFGKHGKAKSFQYFMYYNAVASFILQTDWSWCGACAGLFWSDGKATAGSCPNLDGYGPHVNSGYNYCLPYAVAPALIPVQAGWLFCSQCHGLFYCSGDTSRGGVCPLYNSAYSHNGEGSYGYFVVDGESSIGSI
jgi:hypothetical protein